MKPNLEIICPVANAALSPLRLQQVLKVLDLDAFAHFWPVPSTITRAEFAIALNMALFADLLDRVPSGADYVRSVQALGEQVMFDHGALRTICLPDGAASVVPAGHLAFERILVPMGYEVAGIYPLPGLKMTGYAYAHSDFAEAIPQFFVSELHIDQFSSAFQSAAVRIFGDAQDRLGAAAEKVLRLFGRDNAAPASLAMTAIIELMECFARTHAAPSLSDYEVLLSESAEAAWIATEGNAFNHATDRVADVELLANQLRRQGRPIKDKVEYSGSGRVRQTALRADRVNREFTDRDGNTVVRSVPGSFYEFISRDTDPATGKLDLSFDSSNAQGIFAMTKAA